MSDAGFRRISLVTGFDIHSQTDQGVCPYFSLDMIDQRKE